MAKAKKRATRGTVVKKSWYPITAPRMFNEQVIGEILIAEPSKAIGRMVPANLMNLTRDMKKQNINVMFKIINVTGSKLYTEFVGYDMQASSIKRMVRRGKKKIDYTFSAVTGDGVKIKLKAIIVTRNNTNLSTLTSLRKACRDNIRNMFAKIKCDDVIRDLISHKTQSIAKKTLGKIYPLKLLEFRSVRLGKKSKVSPAEKKVVAEEKKVVEKTKVEEKPKKEAE